MKKIIRIASVIALASASLLYVGCTKDFSADIAKTNQDVAALNQKIETLNSTVQTINGTVENLKTTKADLSAVNALGDKVTTAEGKITTLGGKIDDLDGKLTSTKNDLTAAIATAKQEAIDAASADAATKLAAAKTELEGVINGVKAKVDSLEAFTVAQTDSLRKDVDSLYANYKALEARIAALEGKVVDLAARVSSIVAVPSMNAEFRHFDISNVDTTFFAATFAVTPKAAVENIKEENLTVNFKEGLTRGAAASLDTTVKAAKVVTDVAKGEITVFVKYSDTTTVKNATNNSIYYSLSFAGEDKAGKYEENSEYVKAHGKVDKITDANAVIVKNGKELTADDYELKDTLAFNSSNGTQFASLFKDLDVAFKFNDELISREDIANLLDTTLVIKVDTTDVFSKTPSNVLEGSIPGWKTADTTGAHGIIVTKTAGTQIFKATKENVGYTVGVESNGLFINSTKVLANESFFENHFVGAKTVEYTLPAVTEPWTYTSYNTVSRTVSITDCADVHAVVPTSGIEKDAFKITPDSGTGVNIAVTNALRNPEAKDTVYNVAFKHNVETLGPNDTVNFTINWKYTLEGRPADKTIALADVDTLANDYTQRIELAIDSKIVDKTFAAFDAAYDKTIDTTVVKNAIKAKTSAINAANVYFEGDTLDSWTVSNGKVVVPALTKAGAYEVELEAEVFGIKYTYTYTIKIDWKAKYELHATPYVSGGEAIVDADTTDGVYTLKNMDIAKYLQVFNADTLAKDIPNDYIVRFKVELEDSAKFDNGVDDIKIGGVVAPESATINGGFLNECKLEWGDYNGRVVKVTAYLANDKDTVNTYTFTLRYKQPITSFSAGTQEVKRVAGVNATAVLSKSFEVKGLYHGDKNLIVDTTGAWINGKNYYGCEIGYDLDHAVFKVDGVETTFRKGIDYEFAYGTKKAPAGPEEAVITFIGDNNNKNIEATIPVVLGYKYDYNHVEAYKDNVVIKVVNE